ncbi:MAG: hypothetical protein IJV12_01945 [Acidaminococcaceae bacterium]|nr:hypothetical protein [Acidaminococcaceae bacterium]
MLDFKGKSRDYAIQVMKKIWLRQLAGAMFLLAAGAAVLAGKGLASLLPGIVWALLDDGIIFGSTLYGYGAPPQAMRRILVRMFITRLSVAVIFVFTMLGLKLRIAEPMIGFILLHIFLIFNLQNFTRPGIHTFTGREERRNKDGNC